ncbi:MAG: tetratricopeptide repeat protein [Saprospiraceae bacterium]
MEILFSYFYEKNGVFFEKINRLFFMKKLILLFFFLTFQTSLFSIDSLLLSQKLEQLEQAEGIQKLKLLSELSFTLRTDNNAKARSLGEKALILAASLGDSIEYYNICSTLAKINTIDSKYKESIRLQNKVLLFHQNNANKKGEAEALKNLGSTYSDFGNYRVADSLMIIGEFIFRNENDKSGLMDLQLQRGINFLSWTKYPAAEKAFKEALELGIELKDIIIIPKLLNNLGIVARRQSKLKKALEYYFQAILNHQPTDLFKAKIYNNIGIIYKSMGDFDQSLEFFQKSLAIKEKLKLKKSIAYTLHNMGTLYREKLDYGEALKYYNRSLELKKQLEGSNNGITMTLNNIGIIHQMLGNYAEAEIHYQTHLKISEEEKNNDEICRALNNLSSLNLQQKKYQTAIKYGLRSLKIAEQVNYPTIIRSSSENLAESYRALGDSYKYLFYQNQYWVVNDSILNKETILEISKLEQKYEQSLKEQDSLLQNEKLKNLENQQSNHRLKTILMGLVISVCLLIIGRLAFKFYQRSLTNAQKRLNLKLEKSTIQVELLEEKISHQQSQFGNQNKVLSEKEKKISALENEIGRLLKQKNKKPVLSDIHSILSENLQTDQNWEDFKRYFSTVHKDFFKTIKSTYPNLTTYDLNLCAFIKLNLHNKEIAQILGISPPSVKKARQRLFQKMNLENNESLVNYIIQL